VGLGKGSVIQTFSSIAAFSGRIRRNRKGLSVVISTVILSATLLVVVLTASSYANQLLEQRFKTPSSTKLRKSSQASTK
jgi:hypothetical protein